MPTANALFEASDLASWLQLPSVDEETAATVERVVWGWLAPALKLTDRPSSLSPQVFSWALELGGIAHENPAGLEAYQLGEERSQYSSARRAEILDAAGASVGGGSGGVPSPVGSFPTARCYPDPAERWPS